MRGRLRTSPTPTRRSSPPIVSGSAFSTAGRSRRWPSRGDRSSPSARLLERRWVPAGATTTRSCSPRTTPSTGLWRVSANGGPPAVLTRPDAAQLESDHAFPSMLPGSQHVLFTIAAAGRADSAQIAVLDLKTGERKTLVRGGNQAEYIDDGGSGQPGHLIFAVAGTLRAVRFDPVRLEVGGDPVTVERVMMKPSGAAGYAVSRLGTLVYVPDGAVEPTPTSSLVWVDRKGREEPLSAPPGAYGPPRVSPDGTHVAVGFARSGEHRGLDLGSRAEGVQAVDLQSWHGWSAAVDARRTADHLHVGPRGRAEPVQPGRRRRHRRPIDDECDSPVADVHHAGWDPSLRLRGRAQDHAGRLPGSAAESHAVRRQPLAGGAASPGHCSTGTSPRSPRRPLSRVSVG